MASLLLMTPPSFLVPHEVYLRILKQTKHIFDYFLYATCEIWQAYTDGLLLDSEKTDELKIAVNAEAIRQAVSARDRANVRVKLSAATTGSPPSNEEFNTCVLLLDDGVQLTGELQATLMKHSGYISREPHRCQFFLAHNPWEPVDPLLKWIAVLSGAWVLSPDCFLGRPGASIKYKPAIFTKRRVWVSPDFQRENPSCWIALLELLQSHPGHSWKLLPTPAAWATARARAETVKRPTEVLAFVSSVEAGPMTPGTWGLASAIDFLANVDKSRGSIGLLHM